MKSTAVQFGPGGGLLGVMASPDGAASDTAYVFLNAGFTHHVGPQRIHVQLARALAAEGHRSLRFDYSGIGDSPRAAGATSFAERAVDEARAAIDWLASEHGVQKVVLFGICWGADNAVRVAAEDERVVGVVAVDFYAVMSMRYFLRFYSRRLLNPRSWSNILSGKSAVFGKIRQLFGARGQGADGSGSSQGSGEDDLLPVRSPQQVVAEIRGLAKRGVRFCFAYAKSGGSYDQYMTSFRRPMAELSAAGSVSVRIFEHCDHVFTPRHSQAELLDSVVAWARGSGSS